MTFLNCIFVGIGGFLGAVCRYLIGLLPYKMDNGFPIKTLIINVIGAFVLSLITALAAKHEAWNPQVILMLRVGVCGGFTTFSTFACESMDLMKAGSPGIAIGYMLLSMLLGLAAVFAAQLLVR